MNLTRTLAFVTVFLLFSFAPAWTLTTNYTQATSFQNQRKIVRAPSGTLALVYQKGSPSSSRGLWLATSRDGGLTWSDELKVAAVSAVFADVHLAPNSDIDLVYSTNSDDVGSRNDVVFVRLRYSADLDQWTVARSARIYDAGDDTGAFNAVLARDGAYLWVAYRHYDRIAFSLVIRYSSDDGLTWQDSVVADDPGGDADETATFAKLQDRLAVIYYHQNARFKWRVRHDADPPTSWGPAELIHEVSHPLPSKSAYSVVVDAADEIHLLFNERGIRYLKTDAGAWGTAPFALSSVNTDTYPTLASDGTDFWAVWQQRIGSEQESLVFKRRDGATGAWSSLAQVSPPSEQLAACLFAYNGLDGSFTNLTSQAANKKSGDMKHATTGTLVKGAGDAVYFGGTVPFDYLRVLLSTKGTLGEVTWEYWNGADWTAFVPVSGAYNFTANASVQLWPDPEHVPADWETTAVNGSAPLYYVRARVSVAYSTGVIGTQMTSHKYNRFPTSISDDQGPPVVAWMVGTKAVVAKPLAP
jgi:hypothetical protein